ncbi:uncharacterized protein LOC143284569 isoform X2 [Babylonia areolata]|uniref:uncharacterized protein LOC143284569 isoform X2 n=1 Tax=Babylonia areolata TaxID=304850 RepID=UPI003FD54AD3
MAASRVLKQSLPPVLDQYYLPESTTRNGGVSSPTDDTVADRDWEGDEGGDIEEGDVVDKPRTAKSVTVAAAAQDGTPKARAPHPQGKKAPGGQKAGAGSRKGGAPPPRREMTALSLASTSSGRRSGVRRADAERLEHVADVWDQARAEVLSERHGRLQERVTLQQRLVRAHDAHAAQLRELRQEQEALKRQEEKRKKQSKEAALQDICRQSLDEDRQKATEETRRGKAGKAATAAAGARGGAARGSPLYATSSSLHSTSGRDDGSTTSSTTTTSSSLSPVPRDGSADSGRVEGREAGGGDGGGMVRPSRRHPGYLPSKALPERQLPSTPMRELEDEGSDPGWGGDAVDGGGGGGGGARLVSRGKSSGSSSSPSSAGKQGGSMPSHHAQLYQLYGKQADYFLHPKPSQPAQPQKRQSHPKLKNQKAAAEMQIDAGHIGAGELWDTLRKDSKDKLIRNDLRFPQELKSAFSAFVRERLTKHVRPVERSFCATEDVPDIQRLMDQSKLRNTRLYRHKTELMYRSSINNMDRTSILLHSNPMPDITGTGVGADSISRYLPSWLDTQSEMSEPEYMKWVRARKVDEEEEGEEEDKENVRHSAHSRQLSETANELQNIWYTIAARKKKPKTPRFQFLTEKEAECEGEFTQKFQEEKEQREKPQPHSLVKAYSALDFSHPASSFSVPPSQERGRSAQTAMQLHRYRSDWQPLSMAALVEYKKQVETEGQGDFEHGRVKMWPATTSSVA